MESRSATLGAKACRKVLLPVVPIGDEPGAIGMLLQTVAEDISADKPATRNARRRAPRAVSFVAVRSENKNGLHR